MAPLVSRYACVCIWELALKWFRPPKLQLSNSKLHPFPISSRSLLDQTVLLMPDEIVSLLTLLTLIRKCGLTFKSLSKKIRVIEDCNYKTAYFNCICFFSYCVSDNIRELSKCMIFKVLALKRIQACLNSAICIDKFCPIRPQTKTEPRFGYTHHKPTIGLI